MYRIKTLAGAITLLAAGAAFAQDAQKPVLECTDKRSATEMLEGQIIAWRQSSTGAAFAQRDANTDLVLLISDPESVISSTNSAQFGKSRELAFAKSFLATQATFVKQRSESIATETASELFKATPSQSDLKLDAAQDENAIMRIGEKVFALTEASLDNALRDAGVSDEDIQKTEPSKKIQLSKESITRSAVMKALGEVAGVLPVQNFEATDCDSRAAVAVVSVFSLKNLEFAKDVVNARPIMADKDRISDKTLIATVDGEVLSKEILDIYGLRKVHDQSGYPSLVSYGQWSYVNDGATPRNREMSRKAALIQAESNAKAQIATFLNGSAQSTVETMTQEVIEEFVNVTKAGEEAGSTHEMLEKQFQSMASKAKVKITGLRTLSTWTMEHPGAPGVTMVGSVVAWSPQFADAINQATGSNRRQAASEPVKGNTSDTPGQSQVRSSKAKNNAADF